MTALAFEDVRLNLGSRTVLESVSFQIADGEFIGVLGRNGAGKTTLLRAVLGLVAPARGRIAVLGQPAGRGNGTIGIMPQSRDLSAALRLRGWDVLASAASGARWGLPVLSAAQRADMQRVLALTDAEDLAQRPLHSLSGGERQRLLLAQALLGEPRLLLLDEPLASLDPSRQTEIVALVRRVQRQLGIAVLFSAHELNPLLGAMDRVLYLGSGQAALGGVDQVITGPVLSRLYGTEIEVVRLNGRIFVMAGAHEAERNGQCAAC